MFQLSRVAEARSLVLPELPPPHPQTLGTGRASGSYLLLARRTSEACAGKGKARAAQCLSVLQEARFGADVLFSVEEAPYGGGPLGA